MTFLDRTRTATCIYYIAYLQGRKVIYFGRNGDFRIEAFPAPK